MPTAMTHLSNVRYRLLAVDDEVANLNLLKRTFHRDYDVEVAENGLEALGILAVKPIDLIISDQRMPGMSGVQMLAECRDKYPDSVRILLTAYADVHDIIASINLGQIYRYILKPWSPDELRVTIAKALEHFHLEQENRRLVVRLQRSLEELQAAQKELVQRERLSTLGRMASSIIHDLKLPMSNIRTSAALLSDPGLDSSLRREFADIIQKEVDRLVEMTREILEFSRGESSLKIGVFALGELLEDIVHSVERDYLSAGIIIEKDWMKAGIIEGDRDRLRRVFYNLISNARDAMATGGRLDVTAEAKGEEVSVIISDSGPGIPAAIINTLFEPFVTYGKHNGTGLGMTIAKKIIEGHHGTIAATNKPNGGAMIQIMLPKRPIVVS